MGGNPPRSTEYRDQALARVTSGLPDAGYYDAGRVAWRAWVAGLARRLDGFPVRGLDARVGGRVLLAAFRAFLPLADPEWWRARSPARLNAGQRRTLRGIRKLRKRARRGWARGGLGALELKLCDALEVFTRHGDGDRFGRCLEVIDALAELRATEHRQRRPVSRRGAAVGDVTQ